jgi:hypothetical protein
MIQLRDFTADDYPTVETWWAGHGWSPVPLQILPRLGIIADMHHGETSTPTAAAWLYMDNSVGVAMLEWIVTNPEAKPRDVLKAITEAVNFIKTRAAELGYTVILATCRQESLSKVLQKRGFNVTDSGMIHHLALL